MFGNWFRPHGYNIAYHPVLIDWVRHLNKDYEELTEQEVDECIVHINNCVSHDMKWREIYNMDYDPQTQKFILHGFPKHGFPEFFKVSSSQMKFLLARMGYNHGLIHVYKKDVILVELFLDDELDELDGIVVEFVDVSDDELQVLNGDGGVPKNPCNILTPEGYDDRGLLDF